MKKITYFLLALPLMLALANCKEPENPVNPVPVEITLELSGNALEFDYDDVRQPKIITATTNAESIQISMSDAAGAIPEWVSAAVENVKDVSVAVVSQNLDVAEQPRTATITVTAGDKEDIITVTQLSYIETDGTMTPTSEELVFTASGTLTQEMEISSKVTLTSAEVLADNGTAARPEWITDISIAAKKISVTVVENTDLENGREAVVTVKNRLNGETTFKVVQDKKQPFNLAGTWSWSSLNPVLGNAEGWEAATTKTGTATITAVPGGYEVKGIIGAGELMAAQLESDNAGKIRMTIRQQGDEFYVGIYDDEVDFGTRIKPDKKNVDLMYQPSSSQFYMSGASVSTDVTGGQYTLEEIKITRTVDGTTEILTYPTQNESGATLSYIYYALVSGRVNYLDFHRNLVLTRTISEN